MDFCAPNLGRPHRACSPILGGRNPGYLPCALRDRRLWPWCEGMAEDWTRKPRCITGVIASMMAGWLLEEWRHCLGGFRAGQSWRWHALGIRSRQYGRKSPLVGRWRRSLPLIPRALFLAHWCVPWGPECLTSSQVSFWLTQHSMSRRNSLQNFPPTRCHCQGLRANWGTRFDHSLVVRNLNLFCHYQQPPVWRGQGRRSQWGLELHGRCWYATLRQANQLL